jgi:hypothetical protein
MSFSFGSVIVRVHGASGDLGGTHELRLGAWSESDLADPCAKVGLVVIHGARRTLRVETGK